MNDSNNNEEKLSVMGRYMMFAMWIVLLGLLSWFFYQWQQDQMNPNSTVASMINNKGQTEVVLQANRQGQYHVSGTINNTPVVFLLDTGANNVSIPGHVAEKIGLKKGYKIQFETANGSATGYRTKIENIAIGGIVLNNISASINPNVNFDEILLGMSFLKHVEMIQKNNILTLRY